jgi:hypothetical protein
MFTLRRADGEMLADEYTHAETSSLTDWEWAHLDWGSDFDHDPGTEVTYVIEMWALVGESSRTFKTEEEDEDE